MNSGKKSKFIKSSFFCFEFISFLVVVGLWWFLPDKGNICHRYLDGRYSKKTATKKLLSLRVRMGSEFGIVDTCNNYIPYVDPDKLILNKEGFWDSFYSDK